MAYETDYFFFLDSITIMLMLPRIAVMNKLVNPTANISDWYTVTGFTPFRRGVAASAHTPHLLPFFIISCSAIKL
jgi:hypothetical protein